MNTPSLTLPPGVATLRQQLVQVWQRRAPRERLALTVMAVALAVLAVWLLFVQPAWRTLRDAPAQLDRREAEVQRMQRLAAEARDLRGVTPVSPSAAAAALQSATTRLGSGAKIVMQGDRATLTLTATSADALSSWLLEARSTARARPVEAQLARAGAGYSGTLTVTLGSSTP